MIVTTTPPRDYGMWSRVREGKEPRSDGEYVGQVAGPTIEMASCPAAHHGAPFISVINSRTVPIARHA
jgi:hypothetical protein